ncbi:hypothetical protein HRbin07_00577 [bacterium HR07]|nr:hypothetical protein HRbin07_00577 [bacterium HR07]
MLAVDSHKLPIADDRSGVVDAIAVLFGKPDDRDEIAHLGDDLLKSIASGSEKFFSKEEVFWRIAGECQFGEGDDVGALSAGALKILEDLAAIARKIADGRIDLG